MKIISNRRKLTKLLLRQKNLGFVPTMGAIHEGHVSLIKKSVSLCNKTIVTIFVNKPQFNKTNDYKKYPRAIKKDIRILKKQKVDYLYLPSIKQIYPNGCNKKIKISPLSKKLCGKFRPRHFEAVVDVINRFIKIIKPKKIFLGEKDMQQLKIIEEFFKRNKINIKVIGCKTVREKSGIAFSSRNFLLSFNEKSIASTIYRLISSQKNKLIKKKIKLKKIKKIILKLGARKIDYLKIIDVNRLIKSHKKNKKYKIFIAYYFRSIRLIDNI